MALKVTKAEVWSAMLVDRAGGAADKLEALARAGADLELVFARRTPEQPGSGILFVNPVKGAKATRAAQEAGLAKTDTIHWVRIEGGDKPGLGAKITRALGNAAISFRGLSAIAIGTKFITYIALDSADDAARAVAVPLRRPAFPLQLLAVDARKPLLHLALARAEPHAVDVVRGGRKGSQQHRKQANFSHRFHGAGSSRARGRSPCPRPA